jgi:hypothetical protein
MGDLAVSGNGKCVPREIGGCMTDSEKSEEPVVPEKRGNARGGKEFRIMNF